MKHDTLALQITFSDPANVKPIEDYIDRLIHDPIAARSALAQAQAACDGPDSSDSDDCSIYAVAEGDDDYMHAIEVSLGESCDCGNRIFSRNRCTNCGAQAPWAAKLGCGLA